MQRKTNYLAVFATVMTVLFLIAGAIAVFKPSKEVIPEGYVSQVALENAVNSEVLKVSQEKDSKISDLQNQIVELNKKLAEKATEETKQVVEKVEEATGYLIDEIYLDKSFSEIVSDREVKKLLDTKIDFKGDSYDIEEVVSLNELEVKANEKDFEGNPYLVIPRKSISYKIVFDNDLDKSEISEEDPLDFSFLGENIEITEWVGDEITISSGKEAFLDEGQSVVVDGKTVKVEWVSDNNNVYVTVDNVGKELKEGQIKTINSLQVKANLVIFNSVTPKLAADLIIGEDIEKTVSSGDELFEDSIWDYEIDDNSIGIVLNDEFTELDDELKPLAPGESVCLPNDYVCVRYDGFVETDTEEIRMELDTKDGNRYVEVRGNFQSGLEDYSKLYINSSGIYDKDLEYISNQVEIDNSDSVLKVSGDRIVVEDFNVRLDLKESNLDDSADYNLRTDFGILVSNPEDSVDDQDWDLIVPVEKLESTVTVI